MKVIVYTRLSTTSDTNGNPRRLYVVKEIDTDNPHNGSSRLAVIVDYGNGKEEVFKRFPGAIMVGDYHLPPVVWRDWLRVKKSDDQINKMADSMNRPAIGYWSSGLQPLEVVGIRYGIDDELEVRWAGNEKTYFRKVKATSSGRTYINFFGSLWYEDECLRSGI